MPKPASIKTLKDFFATIEDHIQKIGEHRDALRALLHEVEEATWITERVEECMEELERTLESLSDEL